MNRPNFNSNAPASASARPEPSRPGAEWLGPIKEVLAREWKVSPSDIPDDAALNRFERWDSLGHITILLALQARFGLALTAESVQSLTSLPRIAEHLQAQALPAAA